MTLISAIAETTTMRLQCLLAPCHVDRARFYRLVGKLVSAPPDEGTLVNLRSILEQDHTSRLRDDRALRQLRAALENARVADLAEEFDAMFRPQQAPTELRCDGPESWVLALACGTAEVPASSMRTTEIAALAVLAEKTAWALAAAERSLFAAMMDISRRLLEQHSGRCLGQFARHLERSPGAFYGRVGLALRWRLEDDAQALAMEAA